MTIRDEINSLYAENQKFIEDGIFIFNTKIKENSKKIKELQSKCIHEFHNGKCIHCDKEE